MSAWAAAAIVIPATVGLGVWIGLVARNARIERACDECNPSDD